MERVSRGTESAACDTVAGLNEVVRSGGIRALAEESLAAYEDSLDEAAAKVMARLERRGPASMLWVAGPSSSGKTTTTVKLTHRLRKRGLRFLMLNLDDYFWSLVEHPTDWINDRNYETPEAMDIQLLNAHLKGLLAGETIDKPIYSFKDGRRVATKPIKLEQGQVLLLDCLHGLYPPITEGIAAAAQFRLYIETQNVLHEGDGSDRPSDQIHRRALAAPDAARRPASESQPAADPSPLALCPGGRTLQHHPLERAGRPRPQRRVPLRPARAQALSLRPRRAACLRPEDLEPYAGFLDARIRYERVKGLLDSVAGLTREQAARYDIIPGDALVREFIGGSTLRIPHNQ